MKERLFLGTQRAIAIGVGTMTVWLGKVAVTSSMQSALSGGSSMDPNVDADDPCCSFKGGHRIQEPVYFLLAWLTAIRSTTFSSMCPYHKPHTAHTRTRWASSEDKRSYYNIRSHASFLTYTASVRIQRIQNTSFRLSSKPWARGWHDWSDAITIHRA